MVSLQPVTTSSWIWLQYGKISLAACLLQAHWLRGCRRIFGRNSFWSRIQSPQKFGDQSSGQSSPSFHSFVPCNVPLAAVLWNGGISFGGVIAFIYADLIVLPIIDIYRKYYGWKVAGLIVAGFYVAMVVAALLVELFF